MITDDLNLGGVEEFAAFLGTDPRDLQEVNDFLYGDEDVTQQLAKKGFEPSPYQQAIFDFVATGNGHGVVYGVAGCGKTTTNIQALNYVPSSAKVAFLAFNKHIAQELQDRGVDCARTFHSLGNKAIKSATKAKFNQYKIYDTIDRMYEQKVQAGQEAKKWSYDDKSTVAKIIGLLKANLKDPLPENIREIIFTSGSIHVDYDDIPDVVEKVSLIWANNEINRSEFDFDDMIYWPAMEIVPVEQFDWLFVDECQDLNRAQITFAEKSLAAGGRMLLIGDPHQSIYAFRGAFVGIMEYMQAKLAARELPLTVSYRAPMTVVEYVHNHFEHITFEPGPAAKAGSQTTTTESQFLETVTSDDGVICRTNAPLVKPCFALIRQGKKATILGRDIGQGLISLINKRAKLASVYNAVAISPQDGLSELLVQLKIYLGNEKVKLEKLNKQGTIAMLEDKVETIIAISDNCNSIKELRDKIKSTFSDQKKGVIFSTVHKAKGLEWDRIFVLAPHQLPHPLAQSPEDQAQETNIHYVAVTRTKDNLVFVYPDK